MPTKLLLLMGVSGSGKTTLGALLAGKLNWPYADADSFHSAANVSKMAAGHALDDADRIPWLQSIRAWIDAKVTHDEPGIVSCSCLKRKYRDVLRRPEVTFVYLRSSRAEIERRMVARHGHFFKSDMLDSQFADLEEPSADENVIIADTSGKPAEVVDAIVAAIGAEPRTGPVTKHGS